MAIITGQELMLSIQKKPTAGMIKIRTLGITKLT
jgi:hypothetical protein